MKLLLIIDLYSTHFYNVLRNYYEKANTFYLNVEPIMSGRGEIFTTPRSDIYQFRSWISDERKYYGKSLKTRDKQTALRKAEEEVLNITFSQTQ